jgi:hypothetical protein
METTMPDRSVDRSAREPWTNTVLIGVVLAAGLAIVLLFGSTMFNSNRTSVDVSQPSADIPLKSDNERPAISEEK